MQWPVCSPQAAHKTYFKLFILLDFIWNAGWAVTELIILEYDFEAHN